MKESRRSSKTITFLVIIFVKSKKSLKPYYALHMTRTLIQQAQWLLLC